MKEDIWSSVFGKFSLVKIFGLRSSEIFHEQRSSVFGIWSKSLFGATLVHRLNDFLYSDHLLEDSSITADWAWDFLVVYF